MFKIRPEVIDDVEQIHAVHKAAFPTDAEARLVDRLRAKNRAAVSFVAESKDAIVGHILYSPITIDTRIVDGRALGLAPLAVLPEWQGKGVGAALIAESLKECKLRGYQFVVVLGHPEYYPRFGFRRASEFALGNEYGADEAFMALELVPGSLTEMGGIVRFDSEFAEWS
jgi:putative acetyltransferase